METVSRGEDDALHSLRKGSCLSGSLWPGLTPQATPELDKKRRHLSAGPLRLECIEIPRGSSE